MNRVQTLRAQRLGIDTYKEPIIYMRMDCSICKSEGFEVHARLRVHLGSRSIIATLNIVSPDLLKEGSAGLSEYAWNLLSANEGDEISISHAQPVQSLSFVRSKVYGNKLSKLQLKEIVNDITLGRYSDIHIASFLTTCAGNHMDINEIAGLTEAMVDSGERVFWNSNIIADKHCVGGLPGNRTTPIVVSIVAALGITIPKTSSRAITSPAGTADTMEVLAPVELSIKKMKKVIEAENGCVIWGGALSLSPVDDILIRVERVLNLDSEAQLVASVLSKKIAAGSTRVLIDIPIGPTAKVRSKETGDQLKKYFESIGLAFDMKVRVIFTDGTQPVGRGIGPALEARDVVQVLQGDNNAPQDLRERALLIAGEIIASSREISSDAGLKLATDMIESGKAWKKFQAICRAQGGMREIPKAKYTHSFITKKEGAVVSIDNRRIALVAKLAGAPSDKVAGVDLHAPIGKWLAKGEPVFTIHADSPGLLDYALHYLSQNDDIVLIEE